ncbi:MAG: hypothetical protein Q9217_002584 [Psora testacea]
MVKLRNIYEGKGGYTAFAARIDQTRSCANQCLVLWTSIDQGTFRERDDALDMSSGHFVFPPPPPAPPQSIQDHRAFDHTLLDHNGYGYRAGRNHRVHRGQRREDSRAGSGSGYQSQYLNPNANYGGYAGDGRPYNLSTPGYNGSPNTRKEANHTFPNHHGAPQPQHPAEIRKIFKRRAPSYHDLGNSGNMIGTIPYDHEQKADQFDYGQPNGGPFEHDTLSQDPKSSNQPQTSDSPSPHHNNSQSVMLGRPVGDGYGAQQRSLQPPFYQPDQGKHDSQQSNGRFHRYAQSKLPNYRRGSPHSFPGYRGHGQRRGHEAYGRSDNLRRKTEVAPAVPSFGEPLPKFGYRSEPQEQPHKPKKRPRKQNQLGLTPKTEEHESSGEEEKDVDEEMKLASAIGGPRFQSEQIQITYNGQTLSLQSASDIVSWIEERKKKFPTKVRSAVSTEQKAARNATQEAAKQARRDTLEKQKAEAQERRRKKQLKKVKEAPGDNAAKAKRKVEKLRKQLEKEEKRIARAESRFGRSNAVNASDEEAQPNSGGTHGEDKKRKRSCSTESSSVIVYSSKLSIEDIQALEFPKTSEFRTPADQNPSPLRSDVSLSCSTPELSSNDSNDPTSSSGSSASDDDCDDDEAPEQSTSKQSKPDEKRAPKRQRSKQLCRIFLRGGRCRFDTRCKNLHQLPERSAQAKSEDIRKHEVRKGRIGLYQRLVEQEKEKEKEHQQRQAVVVEESGQSPPSKVSEPHLTYHRRDHFEEAIAALEHAKYALAFSSGSATTATILQSLAQGSHVVSVSDVYGGTHRYFTKVAAAHGVQVTFSPSIELDVAEMIRPGETKLIWIESPSNPTLSLVDIRKVATVAHQHGIQVVVDNTFLSPYIQNPLDYGADIVVHSVTKYINGHSDVLMGCAAFNSASLKERLTFLQNAIGAVPSPFDCWLAHRGLKTLHLRAREASQNALLIANAISASPHTLLVNYPGLPTHKQYSICLKQHRNSLGGGMLSFRIKGGPEAAERFCQHTKIFTLAESLGGIESLVEVPSSMTHAGIPREQREAAGVWDDLVRISCGVEDGEDLKRDVLQALEKTVVGPKVGGMLKAKGGVNGHV